MPLSPEQLELPYFIPTGENVSQILAELRAAAAPSEPQPAQDQTGLTHCFIPNLPTPTPQLKQALRAVSHNSQLDFKTQISASEKRASA